MRRAIAQLSSVTSLSPCSTRRLMSHMNQIRAESDRWSSKLAGQVVLPDPTSPLNTVARSDLPKAHRVCPPGAMMTRDMREDRLNIFTDADGIVTHTTMG